MLRTVLLTASALVAFAANSVLCRLALQDGAIDAASFGLVRLASGALVLVLVQAARRRVNPERPGGTPERRGWLQPAALFVYVAGFSFAYGGGVTAGTGAVLLFGAVQVTMIVAALRSGERFDVPEAAGLAIAVAGLVFLLSPGLEAPPAAGSALIVAAGIAWGVYSLRGRGSRDPLADTARNFAVATLPAAVVSLVRIDAAHAGAPGLLLAVCSGALTSGLGYVAWFAALPRLSSIGAATVQLAVPALAAAGGVVFLAEELTLRLVIASAVILGGVGVAIAGRARGARQVGAVQARND